MVPCHARRGLRRRLDHRRPNRSHRSPVKIRRWWLRRDRPSSFSFGAANTNAQRGAQREQAVLCPLPVPLRLPLPQREVFLDAGFYRLLALRVGIARLVSLPLACAARWYWLRVGIGCALVLAARWYLKKNRPSNVSVQRPAACSRRMIAVFLEQEDHVGAEGSLARHESSRVRANFVSSNWSGRAVLVPDPTNFWSHDQVGIGFVIQADSLVV